MLESILCPLVRVDNEDKLFTLSGKQGEDLLDMVRNRVTVFEVLPSRRS